MHKLSHILIIDDDEINNIFTKIILEDADISQSITVCQSVPEALDLLSNSDAHSDLSFPDLILLDLSMPVYDGFSFLESYYEAGLHETQQAVIFILSSTEDEPTKQRVLSYSIVNGFLPKPLSLVALQNQLSSITPASE